MSAHYVCPSCRRHALRHTVRLRGLPRTPRATFLSFLKPKPPPAHDEPASSTPPDKQPATPPKETEPERPPPDPPLASPPKPSPNTRVGNQTRSDALTSLFNVLGQSNMPTRYSKVMAQEKEPSAPEPVSRPTQGVKQDQVVKPAQKPIATELDGLLDNPTLPAILAWDLFQKHYDHPNCPALKSPLLVELNLMVEGLLFRKLMKRLLKAWRNHEPHAGLPDPVQITRKFGYLGIMGPEVWQDLLWSMSVEVFKLVEQTSTGKRTLAETTSQLMRLWEILFRQPTVSPAENRDALSPTEQRDSQPTPLPDSPADMWSSLPLARPLTFTKSKFLWQFSARLGHFLHHIPPNKITRLSYSALLTWDSYTREGMASQLDKKVLAEGRPFILFIAKLIPGSILMTDAQSSTNGMAYQLDGASVSAEQRAALFDRLKDAPREALNLIGASGALFDSDRGEQSSDESLADFHYKRIARVYSQKKVASIYLYWQMAIQAFPRKQGSLATYDVPPRLYDLTLEALLAFRRSDQAMSVWNSMLDNKIQPTIRTWTAMFVGCAKAKDIHALEQMWARMVGSGVEPDVFAWSARISGILSAGKTQHGIRVLEEMGMIFAEAYNRRMQASDMQASDNQPPGKKTSGKKKSQKDQKHQMMDETGLPAKPSTVILNSAVSALSQTSNAKNQHYLAKVLAWGRSFGIQPDVFTYNALIQMYLRLNNTAEAMKLLEQMEENNVQPDAATFTIILNSVFRSAQVAAASPEEQNEKAMSMLRDLESRGLNTSGHIYSTLIDGLLKLHDNQIAAKAVLNYMAERNIEISPHIYTTLMQHYFQKGDIEAVDALWTQIVESEAVMDIIFYDRMIERYAEINDTDKMLFFLERMAGHGLSPGYPALQAVVTQLADQGNWERFEDIVSDVDQSTGVAKRGMRRSPANVINQFWQAVSEKRLQRGDTHP